MGLALGILSEILSQRDQKGNAIPYCKMSPTVYLRIGEEGGHELGTITIKLSKRTHPILSDNFVHLCIGDVKERVNGTPLTLRGSTLWSDGRVLGGGEIMDSIGRAANHNGFISQNVPSLPLSRIRCSLAMIPLSLHRFTFTSLFFFVKNGNENLSDGIIFGDVIEGDDVLDSIQLSIDKKTKVIITDCGLI